MSLPLLRLIWRPLSLRTVSPVPPTPQCPHPFTPPCIPHCPSTDAPQSSLDRRCLAQFFSLPPPSFDGATPLPHSSMVGLSRLARCLSSAKPFATNRCPSRIALDALPAFLCLTGRPRSSSSLVSAALPSLLPPEAVRRTRAEGGDTGDGDDSGRQSGAAAAPPTSLPSLPSTDPSPLPSSFLPFALLSAAMSTAELTALLLSALSPNCALPPSTYIGLLRELLHSPFVVQGEAQLPLLVVQHLHVHWSDPSPPPPLLYSTAFACLERLQCYHTMAELLLFLVHSTGPAVDRESTVPEVAQRDFPSLHPRLVSPSAPAFLRGQTSLLLTGPVLLSCLEPLSCLVDVSVLRSLLTRLFVDISRQRRVHVAHYCALLVQRLSSRGQWPALLAVRAEMRRLRVPMTGQGYLWTLKGLKGHVKQTLRNGKAFDALLITAFTDAFEELMLQRQKSSSACLPSTTVLFLCHITRLLSMRRRYRRALAVLVERKKHIPIHLWWWLVESYTQDWPLENGEKEEPPPMASLTALLVEWNGAARFAHSDRLIPPVFLNLHSAKSFLRTVVCRMHPPRLDLAERLFASKVVHRRDERTLRQYMQQLVQRQRQNEET